MADPKRRRYWSRPGDATEILPAVRDDVDEDITADEDVTADEDITVDEDVAVEEANDTEERETGAPDADETPDAAPPTRWARIAARLRQVLEPRALRLAAAVAAGLLLCLSFPPFGWWYLSFAAFALLAWVLTHPDTTRAGGFGYGFLFGLAFYVPLLPWISGLVGPIP